MEYYTIGDTQYYISHHGVMGMHWGVRRFQPYGQGGYSPKSDNLKKKIATSKAKIEKNNSKIETLKDYKHSKKQANLEIKETKLRIKRSKYDKRVNAARKNRELYGEDPSWLQRRALKKAYKLDTKISKVVRKQNVWKNKVSKLEYKNMKLENKINKYIDKLDSLEHTAMDTSYLAHYGKPGMKWGKHIKASTQYWLTDQQAANMRSANKNLTDQQSRNINEARPTNQPIRKPGTSSLSDQQAKNGAAARTTISDQQQKNIDEGKASSSSSSSSNSTTYDKEKIDKVVDSVINGNYGNGEERKKALAKEGYDYAEVQNLVNEKLGSSKRHETTSKQSDKGSSTLSDQQSKNTSSGSSKKRKKDPIRDDETYGKEFIHQKAKRTKSTSSRHKSTRKKSTRRQGKNILTDQQRATLYPNIRNGYAAR